MNAQYTALQTQASVLHEQAQHFNQANTQLLSMQEQVQQLQEANTQIQSVSQFCKYMKL